MRPDFKSLFASLRAAPLAAPVPAMVTLSLIAAAFVFSTAENWPGHLSYDSVLQLAEGRSGLYGNWHPPVMSWLLGICDFVQSGTGLFILFDAAAIFGSLALFAWAGRPRDWWVPALAALFLATPQMVIYPGIVWKDILFTAALTGGFAALFWAIRYWHVLALRIAGLAKSAVLLSLAALARQNGMIVLAAAALALGLAVAAKLPAGRRRKQGLAYGAGGLAALFALTLSGQQLLALRIDPQSHNGPGTQIHLLQVYDLIGALHAQPSLALPGLAEDDPELETLMRADGVRLYSPQRNDTLGQSQKLSDEMWDAPDGAVSRAWRGLLLHHPLLYLATRLDVFDWVFLTPDISKCVPFYLGIDGPADTMAQLGYSRRWDRRDAALAAYGQNFLRTPVLNHGLWALIALLVLGACLRRGRPEDLIVAGLAAAALAFTASFFVISIACDYRYLYALDISAMGGALYVAGDWRGFWAALRAGWRAAPSGVSPKPASP